MSYKILFFPNNLPVRVLSQTKKTTVDVVYYKTIAQNPHLDFLNTTLLRFLLIENLRFAESCESGDKNAVFHCISPWFDSEDKINSILRGPRLHFGMQYHHEFVKKYPGVLDIPAFEFAISLRPNLFLNKRLKVRDSANYSNCDSLKHSLEIVTLHDVALTALDTHTQRVVCTMDYLHIEIENTPGFKCLSKNQTNVDALIIDAKAKLIKPMDVKNKNGNNIAGEGTVTQNGVLNPTQEFIRRHKIFASANASIEKCFGLGFIDEKQKNEDKDLNYEYLQTGKVEKLQTMNASVQIALHTAIDGSFKNETPDYLQEFDQCQY